MWSTTDIADLLEGADKTLFLIFFFTHGRFFFFFFFFFESLGHQRLVQDKCFGLWHRSVKELHVLFAISFGDIYAHMVIFPKDIQNWSLQKERTQRTQQFCLLIKTPPFQWIPKDRFGSSSASAQILAVPMGICLLPCTWGRICTSLVLQ